MIVNNSNKDMKVLVTFDVLIPDLEPGQILTESEVISAAQAGHYQIIQVKVID